MDGYIVCDNRGALELCAYDFLPHAGVLLHGDTATVFSDRRRARRAIVRTKQYARDNNLNWDNGDHVIYKTRQVTP